MLDLDAPTDRGDEERQPPSTGPGDSRSRPGPLRSGRRSAGPRSCSARWPGASPAAAGRWRSSRPARSTTTPGRTYCPRASPWRTASLVRRFATVTTPGPERARLEQRDPRAGSGCPARAAAVDERRHALPGAVPPPAGPRRRLPHDHLHPLHVLDHLRLLADRARAQRALDLPARRAVRLPGAVPAGADRRRAGCSSRPPPSTSWPTASWPPRRPARRGRLRGRGPRRLRPRGVPAPPRHRRPLPAVRRPARGGQGLGELLERSPPSCAAGTCRSRW